MKRTALCFLSLTLLYFSLVAHGQKVDHTTGQAPPPTKNVGVSDIQGTELLRSCNMPFGTIGFQFCEAFIVGVRDGVWGRRQHDSRAGKTAGGATSQLESRTEGQNPEELEGGDPGAKPTRGHYLEQYRATVYSPVPVQC